MSCDDERPCQRCIKRNIAHLCRDKDPSTDSLPGETKKQRPTQPASESTAAGEVAMVSIAPANSAPVVAAAAGDSHGAEAAAAQTPSMAVQGGPSVTPMAVPYPSDRSASLPGIGMAHGLLGDVEGTPVLGPGGFAGSSNGALSAFTAASQGAAGPAPSTEGGRSAAANNMKIYDNPLMLFGNDVASNEFTAINEFLNSLQRGVRGPDILAGDRRSSQQASVSPIAHPSNQNMGSPLVDSFQPMLPPANSAQQHQPVMAIPHTNGLNGMQLNQTQQAPPMAAVQHAQSAPPVRQARMHSLPTISQLINSSGENVTQTERFLLTAADPNDGTSEDKLRQIINAKYEAGFLKPYNYVSGYTRMQRFMETHMSRHNIIRILEVLNTFRPTFRTIAQSLTDIDLLLVEEGFERLLLDYDNVFNSFGVPACLWRRTGEIYKANGEFADLVGVPLSYFHEGKVCIYELMTESSTVNYWEKYGEIAFDATQKAVLTSCMLQTAASVRSMVHNNPEPALGDMRSARANAARNVGVGDEPTLPGKLIHCCFSFTLRRDKYKIPLAIAGNFMPVQPQK
ncbi:Transcription factor [Linderina pennispora]|nr:Transcription factor [Linderina pennispora]